MSEMETVNVGIPVGIYHRLADSLRQGTLRGNRRVSLPSFLLEKPAFYKGALRSYVGDAVFSYTKHLAG